MAEAVSGLDTNKIQNKTIALTKFGIFQIPSKGWCGMNGKPDGKCSIKCEGNLANLKKN